MNLYRITFKVSPTPNHPNYYGFQFGFLAFFIFGQNQKDAQQRALVILSQLPFEMLGDQFKISDITKASGESLGTPWVIDCAVSALSTGFSYYMLGLEVGSDESAFLKTLFPEERKAPEA